MLLSWIYIGEMFLIEFNILDPDGQSDTMLFMNFSRKVLLNLRVRRCHAVNKNIVNIELCLLSKANLQLYRIFSEQFIILLYLKTNYTREDHLCIFHS